MPRRREFAAFALVLVTLLGLSLGRVLLCGKVLSPADVLFVSESFSDVAGPGYVPANRLLTDPVLQFQPWLEFNRAALRAGRLPLWNDLAGCGAPHLANAQSAPFDPFHLIAYLGTLPEAIGWMALARLWFAGLGMFLLAGAWGLGSWGRWFAGLTFPLCGFLTVWLLYPVTSVAVWLPWLFLATDRLLARPDATRAGRLALVTGIVLLAGHIQTSAHVLLAAGLYALWGLRRLAPPRRPRALGFGTLGLALGLALGAITVVPLGFYLGKSPAWEDRQREFRSPLAWDRPRLLDSVCTAVPYAFGSQRRGHPNLARALGVHNLNESAGGYAGLATLLWLAPCSWSMRGRYTWVPFLTGLTAIGFLGAFTVSPVSNLLRLCPGLDVTDHRRLTLWVAFGLTLLGGAGLDGVAEAARPRFARAWVTLWVAAALTFLLASFAVPSAGPWLTARARAHYGAASLPLAPTGTERATDKADRQVRWVLEFVPGSLRVLGTELLALAALAALSRSGSVPARGVRAALLGLTVAEVFAFGFGLNPALDPADDKPETELIAYLRREVGGSGRILGVGEELLPNTLMRYGLADPRNYDSVELRRNLEWLAPLYEPGARSRTSRAEVRWAGVARARERLREAGVVAVVGATPPPPGVQGRVERVGPVWVLRTEAEPLVGTLSGLPVAHAVSGPGSLDLNWHSNAGETLIVRQTFDRGWRATVDGRVTAVGAYKQTFLSVEVPAGARRVRLRYDPPEVRMAASVSLAALGLAVSLGSGLGRFLGQRLGRLGAAGLESVP